MKPKPYTAKPWEAQAFAERRKTLIVRPVTPQPAFDGYWWSYKNYHANSEQTFRDGVCILGRAPYAIGQRYYVRETWQAPEYETWWPLSTMPRDAHIAYACDYTEYDPGTRRWRPSTQMPQWAARTHFEVVSVQCKRVQEISLLEIETMGVDIGAVVSRGVDAANIVEKLLEVFNADHPGVWDANQWCWFIEVEVKDAT
jgi:hypothetical protein